MLHKDLVVSKKVFIIDAGVDAGFAKGQLSHHLVDIAKEVAEAKGMSVEITRLADVPNYAYDVESEADKIANADYIIFQVPGYWMHEPWQLKKYMDEVMVNSKVSNGDGRHRNDPEAHRKYGTGGILKGKYMISSTWNAPAEAFTDPSQFFEGKGVDGTFFAMHKAMHFIGLKPLKSIMINDIYKNPTLEEDFVRFRAHLEAELV